MSANPYVQGWRELDERYADLVLGKRNQQIAAGCSLLTSLVLAVGIVWLALRSRYVPYVVVTDRLGQTITIPKPLTPSSMPVVAAWMERWEIQAFINDARSVSIDPAVEQERSSRWHRASPVHRLGDHAPGEIRRINDHHVHVHVLFRLEQDRKRPHLVRGQLNRRDAVVLNIGRQVRGFWHRRELQHRRRTRADFERFCEMC